METYADPSRHPSTSVKQAVAALEECDPEQLGTLSAAVDIDELARVFDSPSDRESISFQYCGYSITVASTHLMCIES
ncbi:hypothetical protein SAMN05421858_4620 [Haladaptatus litoreus]|uniref:Halobacterial output domain-containing protein n=1 Tax=Haladaptatus litoreus TaxID=553468 RepID=A0A1N7EY63_9EURY|nr:hypothetical protein SAMN05421858_4620 [Haladaptatus litoreus]